MMIGIGQNSNGEVERVPRTLFQDPVPQVTSLRWHRRDSLADYRGSLLGTVGGGHLLEYATSSGVLSEAIGSIKSALTNRLPGPGATTGRLRTAPGGGAP